MICPKCGREIPDGTVCLCTHETLTLSSNPAVNVIKTVGSSKLFLAMTILKTVSFVLLVILIIFGVSRQEFYSIPKEFYNFSKVDPSVFEPAIKQLNGLVIFYLVFFSLVSAIVVVPYWLHYPACRSKKSGNVSTAGLTFWGVLTWIAIVAMGILFAIFALYMVMLMLTGGLFVALGATGAMGDVKIPSEAYAIVISLIVFVAIYLGAVFGLTLALLITRIRLINRAKTIANTGMPDGRVSRFLIVMTWILGVYSIASSLAALVMLPLFGIAALGNGVSTILSALCLSRYKKEMTAAMYPPVQPVYAQPIYAQSAPSAAPVTEQIAGQPETPTESDSEESE